MCLHFQGKIHNCPDLFKKPSHFIYSATSVSSEENSLQRVTFRVSPITLRLRKSPPRMWRCHFSQVCGRSLTKPFGNLHLPSMPPITCPPLNVLKTLHSGATPASLGRGQRQARGPFEASKLTVLGQGALGFPGFGSEGLRPWNGWPL